MNTTHADAIEIAGYSGYFVKPDGTIWSLRRKKWRELKAQMHGSGYLVAALRSTQQQKRFGIVSRLYVHRIVLEAFVGQCPENMECRHLDGNPQNNRLENLCWGTRVDNCIDRSCHGRDNKGSRHYKAKVTESDVVTIRERRSNGATLRELSEEYHLSVTAVQDICTRRTWRHV